MFNRARRTAAVAGAVLLGSVMAVPAGAGIDPAGSGARVGADLPFVSDNIDVLSTVPVGGAVGATFRGNHMYVTGAEGLRVFDVTNPAVPVPVGALELPHYENEDVSIGGNTLLISADHFIGVASTIIYVIDISLPNAPLLRTAYKPNARGHTASCVADCRYAFLTAAGRGGIDVFDTTTGLVVKTFAQSETGWSHDVQFDSSGVAWVVGDRGTSGWDVTDPVNPKLLAKTDSRGAVGPLNDFIHHNSWRPDKPGQPGVPGDIVLVTEEDYDSPFCNNAGLFEAWRINGDLSATTPAVLTPVGTWDTSKGVLPDPEEKVAPMVCSSHYFDEANGLVAVAWYEQGVRILDVSDPSAIRQVGYFVPPVSQMWSAKWVPTDPSRSIFYAIDQAGHISVLRLDRSNTSATALLPAGSQSNIKPPAAKPDPQMGWGCRITAA